MTEWNMRERILKHAEKDIFPMDDGFYYWGPCGGGGISSYELRIIAEELDRRNKDWEETIERDLGGS